MRARCIDAVSNVGGYASFRMGDTRMGVPDEPSEDERRLGDLGRRLDDLERRAEATGTLKRKAAAPPNTALGSALTLSTEFLAAVLVGGVLGWFADGWLNTRPILMLVGLVFGIATGFFGVFRAARRMQAEDAEKAKTAPALPPGDDEDEA